jgi:phospholipase C
MGAPFSRRRFLQGAAGAAALAGLAACSPGSTGGATGSTTSTTGAGLRPSPTRRPGDRPYPSMPEGVDTMPQVEHVVIYMQENRSYDHYFGMLERGDGFTFDAQGRPTNTNPDLDGRPVPVYHAPSTADPDSHLEASQDWNDTHISVNGGAMDGFIRAADGGAGSMQYYDERDIPFYYGLARTFPLCDRWFCSLQGQTIANRRYLQAATSAGITSSNLDDVIAAPSAPNGVIWERLTDHGITWNDYTIDLPDIVAFPDYGLDHTERIKTFDQFLTHAFEGRLPQVSIISPGHTVYTEEAPQGDIQNGEAYSASIVNAVMNGPGWPGTVLVFMYDEHGGYYDHVAPPAAPKPDDIPPMISTPPDQPGEFDVLGVRVPGMVISPFAKPDYVSSVVRDHTSVLKFLETKFNLGAMTYRDAAADNLLDTLDFAGAHFLEPPTLPEPGLPPGGSTYQPLPRPPTLPPSRRP